MLVLCSLLSSRALLVQCAAPRPCQKQDPPPPPNSQIIHNRSRGPARLQQPATRQRKSLSRPSFPRQLQRRNLLFLSLTTNASAPPLLPHPAPCVGSCFFHSPGSNSDLGATVRAIASIGSPANSPCPPPVATTPNTTDPELRGTAHVLPHQQVPGVRLDPHPRWPPWTARLPVPCGPFFFHPSAQATCRPAAWTLDPIHRRFSIRYLLLCSP